MLCYIMFTLYYTVLHHIALYSSHRIYYKKRLSLSDMVRRNKGYLLNCEDIGDFRLIAP